VRLFQIRSLRGEGNAVLRGNLLSRAKSVVSRPGNCPVDNARPPGIWDWIVGRDNSLRGPTGERRADSQVYRKLARALWG